MPPRCPLRFLLTLVAAAASACGPAPDTPDRGPALLTPPVTAIVNVNVVPMESERVLDAHTVLVAGDEVVAVGPAASLEVPAGADIIDGRGRYLMPGLIDAHVHLRSEGELLSYLRWGVTSIVNLSGSTADAPDPLEVRRRLEAGELPGPALYTSGPSMDGDPPIFAPVSEVVTTPGEARRAVARHVDRGYDFIKLYNNLEPAVVRAAIEAADARDRVVFGHIPREGGRERALERALDAGLDVISHAEEYFFTHAYEGVDSLLDAGAVPYRDPAGLSEMVRLTLEADAAVIPNLSFVEMTRRQLEDLESVLGDPEVRYLSEEVEEVWHRYNPTTRSDLGRFARRGRAKQQFVRQLTRALAEAGVPLLLGTDASLPGLFPGRSAHLELAELVTAGLSPYQALATATRTPGAFIARHAPGAPRFGTITAGSRADLVLVTGNPLQDVANAAAIDGVMARGQWYSPVDLDRLREEWATRHRRPEPGGRR